MPIFSLKDMLFLYSCLVLFIAAIFKKSFLFMFLGSITFFYWMFHFAPKILEKREQEAFWPFSAKCTNCGGALEFLIEGNYICTNCQEHIYIDKQTQRQKILKEPDFLSLKLPHRKDMIVSLQQKLALFASKNGFSKELYSKMEPAIEEAIHIAIDQACNSTQPLQILTVANQQEMIVEIKSQSMFLKHEKIAQGKSQKIFFAKENWPPKLANIASQIDHLNIFALPDKMQVLRMVKRKTQEISTYF